MQSFKYKMCFQEDLVRWKCSVRSNCEKLGDVWIVQMAAVAGVTTFVVVFSWGGETEPVVWGGARSNRLSPC